MNHTAAEILGILDACCEAFTFPMLDNGYVYLAATRMVLFRSESDWALTIEVFGFSPRSGLPDNHIHTFGSRLANRQTVDDYSSKEMHENYLRNNPHNESRFLSPIAEGPWIDDDEGELVSKGAQEVQLRGQSVSLPLPHSYGELGIEFEEPPRIAVFELCRVLAAIRRESVLATDDELRHNLPPGMREILRLQEWHHPDVVADERPSASPTFQQLARVLVTGDAKHYAPNSSPNTHWKHWPDGGSL